jgi:signal transduction histidine kinase
MAALLFVGMLVSFLSWRNIDRLISAPLVRLRQVVARQRSGDVLALAKADEGAAEVRALADDFNELTQTNRALVEEQNDVLRMHELALDVAGLLHSADDVRSALVEACARLGRGMRADRVLLYTLEPEGRTVRKHLQWHRDALPPLPPMPPSLMAQVPAVNEELRRTGSAFVIRDVLDPRVMRDVRAAAFHRATGARSLVMVPVGVGETGIGVLAVMTVDLYRRWRRHEVQAMQQCAGYLGQVIAQVRLNAMQDEQVRQLTALDRQKTDFMATVSHELRTPLTSIAGYLELLEDGDYGELTSAQRSALGIVGRNASRLRGLIEDLLVLNKIEATGLPVSLEEVPVHTLVAGVVEMLRPAAESGRVELVAMPIDPDLVVRVDRGQLERSLINLGSNAVKFTPAGGHASFSVDSDGSFVTINVSDTGIGIPPEDRARLFDRFFRASNATAQAIPGTGLGLAIVRAIVEGHGGSLTVQSVVGKGTTMQVVLPLVAQLPPDVPRAAVGNAAHSTTV